MTDRVLKAGLPHRRWRRAAAIAGVVLATVIAALAVWLWYMVHCEGTFDGVPLERNEFADRAAMTARIKADVTAMVELGPRNSENEAAYRQLLACEKWIEVQWRAQGYAVARQEFSAKGRRYANLQVAIPGSAAPGQVVLITSQYDTLPDSPGANNGAAGVAVLLRLTDLLRDHRPARTLRFVAFANEEDPFFGTDMMGSYHYARRCREDREDIMAMLSLDAIGIFRHEPGSQELPWPFSIFYPDTGDFLAFIGDTASRQTIRSVTAGFKRGTALRVEAGAVPQWVEPAGWSDHSSFWKFGYPGIMVTDTGAFRAASHTTREDTIDKLDFDALARITVGMYAAAQDLSRLPAAPALPAAARLLLVHGAIVLLVGLAAGLPMRRAIVRQASDDKVRAWRVAHATLVMVGILMLVAALILPHVVLRPTAVAWAAWALIAAGYAFALAFIVGARTGRRALTPRPWGLTTLLFAAHLVGAAGSTIGVLLLLYGALEAI